MLCHLQLSTNVSWIKCCAFNSFTFGFRCRWVVPGNRQRGGWPWQPLMSFDGRVAESSRGRHTKCKLFETPYYTCACFTLSPTYLSSLFCFYLFIYLCYLMLDPKKLPRHDRLSFESHVRKNVSQFFTVIRYTFLCVIVQVFKKFIVLSHWDHF
jgi:hypothetical protein